MNGDSRKPNTGTMVMIAAGLAFAAFVYWRTSTYSPPPKPPSAQVLFVWDTSPSAASLSCAVMISVLKDAIGEVEAQIGENSRFALLTTGGLATSLQASLALDLAIPPLQKRSGLMRPGGQSREDFLHEVQSSCQKLPKVEASAIFNAIGLALEELRARGCGASEATCILRIGSDAMENVDKRIHGYLFGNNPNAAPPALIDNSIARLKTSWCGYAQVGANAAQMAGQAVIDRWRPLFKEGSTAFHPYCAASGVQAASSVP